ncbi:MAG: ABC transporter ATP-binding protein [Desulfobacterales bacterium]|nr:ABC transporter ATP-binding protein [Desulfobacterales bacterium]
MPAGAPPMIRLEGISKSFGTVQANRDISLDIRGGRVKALLGENGAGKSTLMSILAGRYQPDRGLIRVDGREVRFAGAKDAIRAGIGMVYQHFMLVAAMSVAENVFLGQSQGFWHSPRTLEARVRALAERFGLEIDPAARVSELSMGEKQRVEILKLLQRQSRVLIFDEPTAVLTPRETDQLFTALRQMTRQNKAIVFISHKLNEVMAVADEIAILRKGRIVDELAAETVSSRAELATRMVGREVLLEVSRTEVAHRQVVLRVAGLSGRTLKNVDFTLRQGEILGIVGVAGNGQKPLVETLCGLSRPEQGTVRILGQSWKDFFAHDVWAGALSYIPEDRQGLATCGNLDLVDNFLLTTRNGFTRGPWLQKDRAERKIAALALDFGIQPPDVKALARQLSGGNLQKMVLAREFFRRPRLIIAEQPTQGLDIAAIEDVWQLLLKAREKAGVLLVTGDLAEALALSDRIAVMFDGRIMDIFAPSDGPRLAQIGLLMAGIQPAAATEPGAVPPP